MDYKKKYKQLHNFISDLYPFMSEYCKEKIEGFLPELKESDDEKIRKAMHIYLDWLDGRNKDYQPKGDYTIRDMIAWLEKQGDQSHWKPTEEQLQTLHTQLNEGAVTYPDDKRVLTTLYEDLMKITTQEEKQNWQKPTDKVEPKFKVGDWVVYDGLGTYKIIEIHEGWYSVIDSNDRRWSVMFENESLCHPWSIQDAKDGDVLAYPVDDVKILIFIYEGLGKSYDGQVDCHALLDGDYFSDTVMCVCCKFMEHLTPATKEQRKLLFTKMKEAGYEWDAENKELKGVE